MKQSFRKVLCLSGAFILSQQAYASNQTSSAEEEVDLKSIERDAQKFHFNQRLNAYRKSKSLSPITALRTIKQLAAEKPASEDNDVSPIIGQWLGLINKIYSEEREAQGSQEAGTQESITFTPVVRQWFGHIDDVYMGEQEAQAWQERHRIASSPLSATS